MKQTLLLALLLLLPSLLHAQAVGTEFSTTASLGGSGKTWRFRITVAASADPPAQGQVKLLNGDAVTSYTDFSGTIELPRTVAHGGLEYRVTTTENPLFEGSGVTGITFGDALTSLPLSDKGFGTNVKTLNLSGAPLASEFLHQDYLGSQLTSLNLGWNASPILEYAFRGCTSLTTLPEYPGVGKGAFAGCPINYVDIHRGSIGNFSFPDAKSVRFSATSFPSHLVFRPELPGAVEPYSPEQFASPNNSLTTLIKLPDWAATIPAAYFYNFTALTTVNWTTQFPITTIGDSAFMRTKIGSAFTAVTSLQTIGKHAFAEAGINTRDGAPALKLQGSLTSIAAGAFANNGDLTHVDLSALNPVTFNHFSDLSVVYAWFEGCPIEEIILPDMTIHPVGSKFSATATLGGSGKTWRFEVTAVASGEPPVGEVKLLKGDAVTSYTGFTGHIDLPRTVAHGGFEYRVTTTENPLFEGSAVTSVYPGDVLTSLPLSDKGFGSGVTAIDLRDGWIPSEYLTQAHLGSTLTTLTAREFNRAFPDYAFAGCTSLKTLTYGRMYYLPPVGKGAFAGCPLENLPATSNSTGPFAFSHAISITLLSGYSVGARYWPSTLIFRPELPGEVEPYSPEQYASPNTTLTTVTGLPDWSSTYVPTAFFYNFTALTTFPWTTLNTVSDSAFMNTQVGSAFTAATSLTTIGRRAFANAGINTRTANTYLKLQASLTSIGPYAFANNGNLTHADLRALDFAKLGLNTLTYLDVVANWFDGCPMAEILYPASIPVGNPTPGFTFYSTASTGGSGKRWRFRITVAASADPPVQGQVKLLRDGEYTSFSGTIDLPAVVSLDGLEYRVTSCESALFEGSGVTTVLFSGEPYTSSHPSYLASLDRSTTGFGFGSNVKILHLNGAPLPSQYLTKDYLGTHLTSLTVGPGQPFPDYAFKDVTSLTTLSPQWDAGIPNVGKGAFAGCPLNYVDVHNGSIGHFSFPNAKSVGFSAGWWPSHLIFRPELGEPYTADSPEQLTAINSSLTTITLLPDFVTTVPNAYFYHFTALSSVNWADYTTIGDSAFMHTNVGSAFTTATSLQTIGRRAFANAGINTRNPNAPLKLQGSVTAIGEGAFAGNGDLTRVDLTAVNGNLSLAEAGGWFEGSPVELLIVGNRAIAAGAFTALPTLSGIAVLSTDVSALNAGAFPSSGAPKTLYLDYGLLDAELTGFAAYTRKAAFQVSTPGSGGAPTHSATFRIGVDSKLEIPLRLYANHLAQELDASGVTATLPDGLTAAFDVVLGGTIVLTPKGGLPANFAGSYTLAVTVPPSAVTGQLTAAPLALTLTVEAARIFGTGTGPLRYKVTTPAEGGAPGVVAVTADLISLPAPSAVNGYAELTQVEVPSAVTYGGSTYRVATFEAGALASASSLTRVKLLATSAGDVPGGAPTAFLPATDAKPKTLYVSNDMLGTRWAEGWTTTPAYSLVTAGASSATFTYRYGLAPVSIPLTLTDHFLGQDGTYPGLTPNLTLPAAVAELFEARLTNPVVLTPKGGIAPSAVSGSFVVTVPPSDRTSHLIPVPLSVTFAAVVPSITGVAPVDAAAAASLANGKPVAMKATVEVDGVTISTPVPADARVQWTSAPEGLVDITAGSAWNAVSIQLTAAAKIGQTISLTATLPAEFGGHTATWDYTIPAPPAAVGEVFGYGFNPAMLLRYKITSIPDGDKRGTLTITADPITIPRPSDRDVYANLTEIILPGSIEYVPIINGSYVYTDLHFEITAIEPNTFLNSPNLYLVELYFRTAPAPTGTEQAFLPGTADKPKYVYIDYPLTSMEWAEGWTVKPWHSVLTPGGSTDTTLTFHHGIHDQLTLPYIIRDNHAADHTGRNPDYLSDPIHNRFLTPTYDHHPALTDQEPALTEVFTLHHSNHVTLHLTPISSAEHESDLKISFAPNSITEFYTPAPLTVHLKAYTPVIDTVFGSITTDKSLKRLRFGEPVTLTANDPYERVEGEQLTRPFKLTRPLRWTYDATRFRGSVPLVHGLDQPYSLRLTPILPSTLNFNVPLTFTLPYPEPPTLTCDPATVSLALAYDTTFLPATARIRATVLVDGVAFDPTPHFLTWHQDEALNLSLAASAPTNPYSTRPPAPVLSVADDGSFTARLISVNPGYGRVHYTLPPTWGSVASPELAFYSVLDLLGVYPPTLVEGRIVLYEVGHPDAPIDLSTPDPVPTPAPAPSSPDSPPVDPPTSDPPSSPESPVVPPVDSAAPTPSPVDDPLSPPVTPAPVDDVSSPNPPLSTLPVTPADPATYTIYTLSGRTPTYPLHPGLYILRTPSTVTKLLVK
jgi:hypothetical protein